MANKETLIRFCQQHNQPPESEDYFDTNVEEYIIFGILEDLMSVKRLKQALEALDDDELISTMEWWEFIIQTALVEYDYKKEGEL